MNDSTALIDSLSKSRLYTQADIPYYLVISPETEETEVYVLEDGEYKLKEKDIAFNYTFRFDDCEATIDFSEIWK